MPERTGRLSLCFNAAKAAENEEIWLRSMM